MATFSIGNVTADLQSAGIFTKAFQPTKLDHAKDALLQAQKFKIVICKRAQKFKIVICKR